MARGLFLTLVFSFQVLSPLLSQERNLNFYLTQSKLNMPLLEDYHNQITSLGIDKQLLKATYGIQVSANSDLAYAPVIKGYGYDEVLTNGQQLSAYVRARKDIIGKTRSDALINSLSLNQGAILNQLKESEATLEQRITEQYILTYADQEQLAISTEIVELLLNEDAILKKLTQSSVFKQTDYLTFKVNLQQQLLAKQQLEIHYKGNWANLNYLAGRVDSTVQQLASPHIILQKPVSFITSLYFEGFKIDSLKNQNNQELIHLSYKPKLSVFADAGYQSSLTFQPYKNMGWSIGLTLSIPIYDGKQRKMLLDQNRLKEKSRKAYITLAEHQYEQLALQFTQLIRDYERLIKDAEKQMTFSKTLVKANALQLRTGEIRITDYILSINNYLNLRSMQINNQSNYLILINQLNTILLK